MPDYDLTIHVVDVSEEESAEMLLALDDWARATWPGRYCDVASATKQPDDD